MAKRRKRKHWNEEEEVTYDRRRRGRRSRRFERAEREPTLAVAEAPIQRPKPPVTCYQCSHLVITRSFVKHVSQSWDRAIVFPTLTCFQQRWTLEDPESVDDKAAVSEYLVGGADRCPDYARGYPRGHDW